MKHAIEWRKKRKDIVLIACVLLFGLLLLLILTCLRSSEAYVEVRIDGDVLQTFPLNVEREYTIQSADGGTNLLVIRDGYAWIEEASCPDGLCKGMGKICYDGQSIICLPNKVVVEVCGAKQNDSQADVIIGGMR